MLPDPALASTGLLRLLRLVLEALGRSVPAQLMNHQSHRAGLAAGGLERDLEVCDLGPISKTVSPLIRRRSSFARLP
jgi:hypothetical protein